MRFLFLIFFAGWLSVANAASFTLTLGELRRALDGEGNAQQLDAAMLSRLQQQMGQLGLQWQGDALSLTSSLDAPHPLEEGCAYSATLERLDTRLTLPPTSRVVIDYSSFSQPVRLDVEADVTLVGKGRAKQAFGVSFFGDCRRYGRDGFDLSLDGAGRLHFSLVLDPGLSLGDDQLVVTPTLQARLAWDALDYSVRVDHTVAGSLLESRIRDEVDAMLSGDSAAALTQRMEASFQRRIVEAWGGPSMTLDLPDAAQREAVQALLQREFRFDAGEHYLRDHLAGLWYALLTADRRHGGGILAAAALCEAVAQTTVEMPVSPLYQHNGAGCQRVDPVGISAGRYYTDAACRKEISVTPVNQQQYCRANFDPLLVGDGSRSNDRGWSLSPGTRTSIALVPPDGLNQPWTTSLPYKRVTTAVGECVLEMRVYKSRLDADGLKPVIALHGGNWQFRTRGILGIESFVPQLTERGFVVFVPFYRLAGDAEGSAACHNARGEEIVADVSDALDWVVANGADFGAAAGPVAVTGQSAGGHLAAWLATHRPEKVSRALLFYPATDMADYLQQWRDGKLGKNDDGIEAVKAFLENADPATVPLDLPLVRDNSLPNIVVQQPDVFPPMYIVHGSGDSVVPLRQAARLCNALGGNIDNGPAPLESGVENHVAYVCDDRGSRLQVIAGAEHMLDICPSVLWCPAGDATAQAVARTALRDGYDWLATAPRLVAGEAGDRSGGGGAMWLTAILLPWWRHRR